VKRSWVTEAQSMQGYAKAALMKIVRLRYAAFVKKFGREPGPHDPLFFCESKDEPTKADLPTTRRQIADGARAAGVKLAPVLMFLGLPSVSDGGTQGQTVRAPSSPERRSARSGGPLAQRPSGEPSVLAKFLADDRLHARYGITREELQAVSGASLLGSVRSVEDILFILKVIREDRTE
jgi:hypothetical protein